MDQHLAEHVSDDCNKTQSPKPNRTRYGFENLFGLFIEKSGNYLVVFVIMDACFIDSFLFIISTYIDLTSVLYTQPNTLFTAMKLF